MTVNILENMLRCKTLHQLVSVPSIDLCVSVRKQYTCELRTRRKPNTTERGGDSRPISRRSRFTAAAGQLGSYLACPTLALFLFIIFFQFAAIFVSTSVCYC